MNTALLLIDIQNDYFLGGRFELFNPIEAALNAQKILRAFRAQNLPVIHVQHINTREGATFFLPETEGVEINECVKPLENETVVIKHLPNSFLKTNLDSELKARSIGKLVVCGMMTHMCIDTTVRACQDRGIEVILIEDACATRDLEFSGKKIPAQVVHNSFMAALNKMFAQISKTEDYLQIVCNKA